MENGETIIKRLKAQNDLGWFDSICEILKRGSPTTKKLIEILGEEKPNPDNNVRGSKFIIPFDKRFDSIYINPNISLSDNDKPLDFLSFYGEKFALKSTDVIKKFPDYRVQINTYDGGSQVFFYPIPIHFEFTALSFDIDDGNDELVPQLYFHNARFHFGNTLVQGREGYSMRR